MSADNDESMPIPFDADLDDGGDGDPRTIEAINARFARGSARMLRLEQELKRNTEVTLATGAALANNNKMTGEMWEVFSAGKSGIEALAKLGRGLAAVGNWIVKVIKYLTPIAAGVIALYHALAALKGGGPPSSPK